MPFLHFFWHLAHIFLDVARYAFDIDVHNLPKTNTVLTSILMTDSG